MKIRSHVGVKKKTKRLRVLNLALYWSFSSDIMAVKGLKGKRFQLWVPNRGDLNLCVYCIILRGVTSVGTKRWSLKHR